MESSSTRTVARRLKEVMEGDSGLFNDVYAHDAVVWHNSDGIELSRTQVFHMASSISRVASCKVDVKQLFLTEDGFVQTQTNTFTINDRQEIVFDSAIVVQLDSAGRVSRVDEYLDGIALAPLIEAAGLT